MTGGRNKEAHSYTAYFKVIHPSFVGEMSSKNLKKPFRLHWAEGRFFHFPQKVIFSERLANLYSKGKFYYTSCIIVQLVIQTPNLVQMMSRVYFSRNVQDSAEIRPDIVFSHFNCGHDSISIWVTVFAVVGRSLRELLFCLWVELWDAFVPCFIRCDMNVIIFKIKMAFAFSRLQFKRAWTWSFPVTRQCR